MAMVVASVLWRGSAVTPVVLVVAALRFPGSALVGLAGWIVVTRWSASKRPTPDDEAAALDRIVAELDGGASPRAAVVRVSTASRHIDLGRAASLARAGLGSKEISGALREAFSHNGPLVSAAWALAADSGAPAAPVMGLLARRAAERGRLERERRALTAQARATAWLIAGMPLAACVVLAVTGRIRSGPALPVVLGGVALQAIGLGIVLLMLRRSR
jgi:tight adherence protein B